DANGNNKIGVPPESIYVTVAVDSGNIRPNDIATNTYADDSTRDVGGELGGFARIQIISFSGGGNLRVGLWVRGHGEGNKTVHIRTTDPDASGRDSLGGDQSSPGDVDWSGTHNAADDTAAAAHLQHWHRNALHGTLVKRTVFDGTNSFIGEGEAFWSPSARYI